MPRAAEADAVLTGLRRGQTIAGTDRCVADSERPHLDAEHVACGRGAVGKLLSLS